MRVAIVGGGIAGAMLALRLSQAGRRVDIDLFTGDVPARKDASGASGGMVRGFEPVPQDCRTAAESLAEIRGSAALREWTGYRETGSVYVLPGKADPAGSTAIVDAVLPGSATVVGREDLIRAYPFRDLPADAVGVVERQAGYISPHGLRAAALAELAAAGASVRPVRVRAVTGQPAVRTVDGAVLRYDAVVVAAGAWTPHLLARSGLPGGADLRTKQIQYSVCGVRLDGLGVFVDETTGLYGRPAGPGSFLLGLPTDRWNVDPDAVTPDAALAADVVTCARRTFGTPVELRRTVASFDCYREPAGLALRTTGADGPLYSFTGGSGGAAKTVVAASRTAAAALLA